MSEVTIEMTCDVDPLCVRPLGHERKHQHRRGCDCRPCIGRRNRRNGLEAQRRTFKAAGGTAKWRGQMANEERWESFEWAPMIRWEKKSGKQVPAWVLSAIAQVEAAHDMGLYRPGLVIEPEGTKTDYCLVRLDDLKNQCMALAEVGQGYKLKEHLRIIERELAAMKDRL